MNDSTFNFIVIDDDTINNSVCTAAIRTATNGKVPLCFTNPEEGMHYLEHEYLLKMGETPSILFLDLNMPEMTGWEWLFKFEQLPHTIKKHLTIYILSSSISSIDSEKAKNNVYVKGYILKPLNKAKVMEVLEAHHLVVHDEA